MRKLLMAGALAVASFAAHAEVTVGVIVGATGPGATIGIPTKSTFGVLPREAGGGEVRYIILDDATDPTNAVRNARKLVTEEEVDLLMGSTSTPSSTAIAEVAQELEVPQITLSPVATSNPWVFTVPQPTTIMMAAVIRHMQAHGVKRVGYIGFSDSWGDLVYNATVKEARPAGIEVVTNERYARNDMSVIGQVLRVMAEEPDAVVLGGSAVPAVLPHVTLCSDSASRAPTARTCRRRRSPPLGGRSRAPGSRSAISTP